MVIEDLYAALSDFMPESKIKINEPLMNYTYTRIGGNADVLLFPTEYQEISDVVKYANNHQIPITILGNASNVLITDTGLRGIVINLTEMNEVKVNGNELTSQSGAGIIEVSRTALMHSLTGLEFACGIPGSIGGAVFMNAGAYGGEVSDVLQKALVLTPKGTIQEVQKEELDFRYRHSSVSEKGYIVLEATFVLTPGVETVIFQKMQELTALRESKQPLEYPSCGSVFKRPPGYFAGKLIQESGLQGKKIGGAQVSEKHAGFIVNVNNATSTDYISLIQHVQKVVKENYGIDLETEVRIIK